MPRRVMRAVPVVVLPGWQGSTGEHWQVWLTDELRRAGRDARLLELPDVDNPDRDAWLAALRAGIADLPGDGFDVVAHSLGSILWLHHVQDPGDSPRPARVALVAPVSPHTDIAELRTFFPVPLDVDRVRQGADGTVVVAGDDDPYLPEGIAEGFGRPLRIATTVVPGGAHLNTEAGYGPWPAMLDWCNRDNLAFY